MFQLVPEARKLPLGGRNRQGFMMGVNRWLAVPHMYTDQKDISTLGLYLLFFRWSPVEVLRYQRICRIQLLFTFDVSYPARVTRVNTSLASVSIIPTLLPRPQRNRLQVPSDLSKTFCRGERGGKSPDFSRSWWWRWVSEGFSYVFFCFFDTVLISLHLWMIYWWFIVCFLRCSISIFNNMNGFSLPFCCWNNSIFVGLA